jgi:hypothetical protein
VFFSHEMKMIPVWFPWIVVGGILFIALSFVGSKYKNKEYKNIQFLQDFISGSILIAFVGVLMPDIFPKVEIPVILPSIVTSGGGEDIDLQVGPPRLIGR